MSSCTSGFHNSTPVVVATTEHGTLFYTHDSNYIFMNADTCYMIPR